VTINLSNPVLLRELRASLRNARAFALLALYVALLGAFVTSQFPGDQSIDFKSDGGQRGQALFYYLFGGQVALILLIIPALATGALAQERERQTLQPLLLSPLSPLQIVWGKAGGVLSLVGLLLVATVPLTSLCFLLGGVDGGMLIGSYAVVFGLAAFTTGFGLYCSARWHSATRAMLMCYLLLPVAAILVVGLSPFGIVVVGFFEIIGLFYAITLGWKRGARSRAAQMLGGLYAPLVYVVAPLTIALSLFAMVYSRNVGFIVVGACFALSYLLLVAHWGLLQTARELLSRADDEPNMRQRVEDLRTEWGAFGSEEKNARAQTNAQVAATPSFAVGAKAVVAPPQSLAPLPSLSSSLSVAILPGQLQTGEAPVLPPRATPQALPRKGAQTYGVTPFLSDKMNPIYARELRSGLLGKLRYLVYFGYGVTLVSELIVLGYLMLGFYDPSYINTDFEGAFAKWGGAHLGLLLVFAAWFGARAIAPEREGQTLEQLFTIPMRPSQIIGGKMMAVLTFTLYVWVLALPMSLLMALLGLVRPSIALWFPVAEAVLGAFAASWGVWCSFHSPNVRRALAMALGGVGFALVSSSLLGPIVDLLHTVGVLQNSAFVPTLLSYLPLPLATSATAAANPAGVGTLATPATSFAVPFQSVAALGVYASGALGLFMLTASNFQKLARSEPSRG